jgi:hypothetical protein
MSSSTGIRPMLFRQFSGGPGIGGPT